MALAAIASLVASIQTARILWARRDARVGDPGAREAGGRRGGAEAEPLLRHAGCEVIARQVAGGWTIYADGEPHQVALRADLVVEREGRRYVAEVKTGKLAPRLDHA